MAPHALAATEVVDTISASVAASAADGESDAAGSFITVDPSPPPGFEQLVGKQTTQADVYFGGRLLTTAFVEYDLTTVKLEDPHAVADAIPNLKSRDRVAAALTGPLPSNAHLLCTQRKRQDCGELAPDVAGVIYDEGHFRLSLFLHADELLLHQWAREKYLPPSEVDRSSLHNLRFSAAGSGGENNFNLASESFFAHKRSRVRARYALSNHRVALHGLSWQRDLRDYEYEAGSFRALGRSLGFTNDVDVLGMRFATSTKTRQDVDRAQATPILLFLPERSRVEVYRGEELLNARYYEAGNWELDTTDFPDGAYDVRVRVIQRDGSETSHARFFARSGNMPPMEEPQYFVEAGSLVNTLQHNVPHVDGGAWARLGTSRRLRQDLSVDGEFLFANDTGLLQGGALWIGSRWHLQAGLMHSTRSDLGFSVRGGFRRDDVSLSFDYRRVDAGDDRPLRLDQYEPIRGSYAQGSATLAFPLWRGQVFLRARLNDRAGYRDSGFGVSYWGSLFRRQSVTADFTLDSSISTQVSWIRAGVTFRFGRGRSYSTFRPQLQFSDGGVDALLDGRWNTSRNYSRVGYIDQSLYALHDAERSAIGGRFVPQALPGTDMEFGLQRVQNDSSIFYSLNNRLSVAGTNHLTTTSAGRTEASAVVVNIEGDLQGKFEVLVDDRVVGHVKAQRPSVISLRPYEHYRVRIRPRGDDIVAYDQAAQEVTLYPGNVEVVTFSAKEITVIISQALHADGSPVKNARFLNVEEIGVTDENGWFQVEVGHEDPLVLERVLETGELAHCELVLGRYHAEQGLAVLDPTVCRAIQAQR